MLKQYPYLLFPSLAPHSLFFLSLKLAVHFFAPFSLEFHFLLVPLLIYFVICDSAETGKPLYKSLCLLLSQPMRSASYVLPVALCPQRNQSM